MIEDDLDEPIVEEEIDTSADSAIDDAFTQLGEESGEPTEQPVDDGVEEPVDSPEDAPEVEEPTDDLVEPEEYLEQLKAAGDDKAKQFEKLVNSNQELKAERDGFQEKAGHYDVLHEELFQKAGLNVDSLTDFIDVFEAVKNGTPTPEVQAKVSQFVQRLTQGGFLDLNNVNQFSGHPDIQQKLQNLEMDEATALEIIRHRERERQQQTAETAYQQHQHQVNQSHQHAQTAKTDITNLSQQNATKSADHAKIEDYIKQDLWNFSKTQPAHLWAGEYQRLYALASNIIRSSADQQKQQRDTNALDPNGKTPTSEMPEWSEDNMVDHAFSAMENGLL